MSWGCVHRHTAVCSYLGSSVLWEGSYFTRLSFYQGALWDVEAQPTPDARGAFRPLLVGMIPRVRGNDRPGNPAGGEPGRI